MNESLSIPGIILAYIQGGGLHWFINISEYRYFIQSLNTNPTHMTKVGIFKKW